MNLSFHKHFDKRYARLRSGERRKCDERIALFAREPFNPILDNHPLREKYEGYRSIDITGDLRAIYEPISPNTAFFIRLGTHPELYGK